MEERLATAQNERLKAGKISGLEVENGKTTLALAKIESEAARRELKQALLRLTAHWGNSNPQFKSLEGSLNIDPDLSEAGVYHGQLKNNPVLEFSARLIEKQRVKLELEKSSRVPDLSAGIGLRRFQENGDNAMVFQLSLPLPLFNRNRGNIQKAQAELSKARAGHKSTRVMLETTFSAAYERLSAAHEETVAILQSVIPSAQLGYELAQESYQLGKFNYFELKTAQAILINSRKKLLNAQLRYHQAKTDLEMLAGKTL
jgi:cobalt-zinc-cadmium efflux system outer membrane protein